MAPEMIKGCYNEKCDIWSIGVILYILLTNEAPFDGVSDADILQKIVKFKTFLFETESWKKRSIGAMDMTKKLCFVDLKIRLSA